MSLSNRLKKNYKHLSKWARRQKIGAFRLYDRDIPEFPYIIDVYNDQVVVGLRLSKIDYEKGKKENLDLLDQALDELGFPKRKRFYKERRVQETGNLYEKKSEKKVLTTVEEAGLKFEVNLSDYLDTGLFLDHRPWRQELSTLDLTGKKALNLFSYTCSLSVALATAKAHVTSNDLNPHYLEWGKRNFILNELNPKEHEFAEGDCLQYVKDLPDQSFDIIVVDPPTFSISKKFRGTWDINRDHYFLLKECWRALKSGGSLYFSCNYRDFKLDEGISFLKETTFKTIPQDFHDKKIHHSYFGIKE
ncbi:MAG: class I SAM-dependent methyltransferase [Bdellovibrionota bacterium]|nr:class I SAM-dependent methyltransferase [Bdellovibrionota bacterium]